MNNPSSNDFKEIATQKLTTLKAISGFEVSDYQFHKGISQAKIEKMESVMGHKIPDELLKFYNTMNGCQLNWSYETEGVELYGFWDIWSLEQLFFGFDGNISKTNFENPHEDMLWNDFFEKKELTELKKHKVVEPIEGDDACISCKLEEGVVKMFYVREGAWKPLLLSFTQYVGLIFEMLGVGDIREQFVKPKFFENPLRHQDLKKLNKLIPMNLSQFIQL